MPGAPELIAILAVALLIFGPQKMPEISRSIGKAIREFHKIRDDFVNGMRFDEDDDRPRRS